MRSVATCLAGLLAVGCAPVFSDLQSARLAGPGRVEVTPSASTVAFDDDAPAHVQDHYGLQVAAGVHDRIDLRLRYERIRADAGGDPPPGRDPNPEHIGVNVLGFGPKLSLIRDRLALAVPVGFGFGGGIESSETWQIQPTLIGTLPLIENLELTASGKYIVPLSSEDDENLIALNLGFGIGPAERWAIRPEIGFLWNPGEEGHFRHLSIGFSFLLPGR